MHAVRSCHTCCLLPAACDLCLAVVPQVFYDCSRTPCVQMCGLDGEAILVHPVPGVDWLPSVFPVREWTGSSSISRWRTRVRDAARASPDSGEGRFPGACGTFLGVLSRSL